MNDLDKDKKAWKRVHKDFYSKGYKNFVFYEIQFDPKRNKKFTDIAINAYYIKRKEAEFFINEKFKFKLEECCSLRDKNLDKILLFSNFDEDGNFLDCASIKDYGGSLEVKKAFEKDDEELLEIMKSELKKTQPKSQYWAFMKAAHPVLKGEFTHEQSLIYKEYEERYGDYKPKEANTTDSFSNIPKAAKWEDVTMTLLADDMIKIKTPQGEAKFTYHQIGLQDNRKGDQAGMLWGLLKLFAKNNGFISSKNTSYDPKLPDTAKRLNNHLKKIFRIQKSIYAGHYKKEKGYKTKIKFHNQTI